MASYAIDRFFFFGPCLQREHVPPTEEVGNLLTVAFFT